MLSKQDNVAFTISHSMVCTYWKLKTSQNSKFESLLILINLFLCHRNHRRSHRFGWACYNYQPKCHHFEAGFSLMDRGDRELSIGENAVSSYSQLSRLKRLILEHFTPNFTAIFLFENFTAWLWSLSIGFLLGDFDELDVVGKL